MKKQISIFCIILCGFITFGQSTNKIFNFSSIPSNSITILVEGIDTLQLLKTEKVWYISDKYFSRISKRGAEAEIKISKGKYISIYTKGVKGCIRMNFSIIKLKNNGRKRYAGFNILTNKKLHEISYHRKILDKKDKIYQFTLANKLEKGDYCLIFKRISDGNFDFREYQLGDSKLRMNPSFITITE